MNICPNCYFQTEEPVKFCPHCGTAMSNVEPEQPKQPEAEYNAGPAYTPYNPYAAAPTYAYAPPAEEGSSIGKKITGMALAVVGVIFAWVSFFYGTMALDAGRWYVDEYASGAIVGAVFGLPLSIVGLALSKTDGKLKGFGIAGKICGIIGIVMCAIGFLMGVGSL